MMDVSARSIWMMEEERRRFARDLHDGPVQVLANTSMRLDVLSRMLEVDSHMVEGEILRIRRRMGQAVIEIRQLIYDLQPVAIDAVGLTAALAALTHRLEEDWSMPITVVDEVNAGALLSPETGMMLYRAIQEAVTNAARHAQANYILVRLTHEAGTVHCEVVDDGTGFDPQAPRPGHYGLGTMKERLTLVGGTTSVDSTPEQGGTRIRFSVPVDHA